MFKKIGNAFKEHPVQNVLIFILVVAVGFMGFKITKPTTSPESTNTSTIAVLRGLPDGYFIPDQTKTTTQAAKANTVSQSTSGRFANLTIEDDLYSYIANGPTNSATGIRTVDSVSSNSLLIGKAKAATKGYPAVYKIVSYKPTGASAYINNIVELNVLTGNQTTLLSVDDPKGFGAISFNSKRQAIAYTVAQNKSNYNSPYDVKIYNLKTKATEDVATSDKHVEEIHWSPDGNSLAFNLSYNTNTTSYQAIYFYDMATKTGSEKAVDNSTGYSNFMTFNWMDDNSGVLGIKGLPYDSSIPYEQHKDYSAPSEPVVMTKDGILHPIDKKVNENQILFSGLLSINGKIIGRTGGNKISDQNQAYGQYGWLFQYDIQANTHKEFSDKSGSKILSWIVDNKADNAVFVYDNNPNQSGSGSQVYAINFSTGTVKHLQTPDASYLRIVGWNGNQTHVIVWDGEWGYYSIDLSTGEYTKI